MITNLTFKLPDLPTNAYTNAIISCGNTRHTTVTEEEVSRLLAGIDQRNFQPPPISRWTPARIEQFKADRVFHKLCAFPLKACP